jgi:hypothetical protein
MATKVKEDKRMLAISGKLELMALFLLLAMLAISTQQQAYVGIGIVFSLLAMAIPAYSFLTSRDKYVRIRNRYTLFFIVLCIITYFATLTIKSSDTTLLRTLGSALITATSISAVFAGTIYERIKEISLLYKKKMDAHMIRMSIRLAIYPLLASVVAVLSSILLLILAGSNFFLTVLLCNFTITAVLVTLLMSVEILREDLTRQLY